MTGEVVLLVGIGAAFLAVLLVLGVFLVGPKETPGARVLRRSLSVTTRGRKPDAVDTRGTLARAAELLERLPTDSERQSALQARLQRAGWALRASEFRTARIGAAAAGLVVGVVLVGRPLWGVLLGVVGYALPTALLARRVSKQERAFEQQLPDVLQLLAGSLRAGYGLLQGLDTVAREASDPAASEFSRVLSEARLGGSVEAAMEAMAERVGSTDFRWVVIAVNIQREVGGNLAALLETVAATIRERWELRRQVRTLSAEGRLSAIILVALPFLVAGYTMMVNPAYLVVLTSSFGGRIAIGLAAVLMLGGIAWIRRVIRIEV
ncbi:MAG: type II secretion system F family protein [Nitriliruptorales bacterium]